MPQLNSGKLVYGTCVIQPDGLLHLPLQVTQDYGMAAEGRAILFTGSKSNNGFCVTRKGLLSPSKMGRVLLETPVLAEYEIPEGVFVRYKARHYCWVNMVGGKYISLKESTLSFLGLYPGGELQCLRSSNIAFAFASCEEPGSFTAR